MGRAADRVQSTRWEFPKGSRVRFLEDVQNSCTVHRDDGSTDHWGREKVAEEGDEGVVQSSGDCDPYPTSYAWVKLDGEESREVLVVGPSKRIVILGSEKDLDDRVEYRVPYEEFPESILAFERHLYELVDHAREVESTFVQGVGGLKGIIGWEASKYLRDYGVTDKGEGIRCDDVEGELILAVVGTEKVQEYDEDREQWECRYDIYFKFFDERGRLYAAGNRYEPE